MGVCYDMSNSTGFCFVTIAQALSWVFGVWCFYWFQELTHHHTFPLLVSHSWKSQLIIVLLSIALSSASCPSLHSNSLWYFPNEPPFSLTLSSVMVDDVFVVRFSARFLPWGDSDIKPHEPLTWKVDFFPHMPRRQANRDLPICPDFPHSVWLSLTTHRRRKVMANLFF